MGNLVLSGGSNTYQNSNVHDYFVKSIDKDKPLLYIPLAGDPSFKVIKTEFVYHTHFESQAQLNRELFDYVHWYNNNKIHGTLGYLSPIEYKSLNLNIAV